MTKSQRTKFQEFAEERLKEIIVEYHKICPGVNYLDMCYVNDSIMITNAEEEEETKISFHTQV